MPGGTTTSDDFFYFLDLYAVPGTLADLTTSATSGTTGYGVPNGTINSDDDFYFLAQYDTARLGGEGTLSDPDVYANRVGYGGYLRGQSIPAHCRATRARSPARERGFESVHHLSARPETAPKAR